MPSIYKTECKGKIMKRIEFALEDGLYFKLLEVASRRQKDLEVFIVETLAKMVDYEMDLSTLSLRENIKINFNLTKTNTIKFKDILRVIELMDEGKTLQESIRLRAKERGVEYQTVLGKCTRQIGLSVNEFIEISNKIIGKE